MSEEFYDPRTDELAHDIVEGQVYGDSRHEPDEGEEWPDHAMYRIVYVDEHVVVLKSNNWTERTNQRRYRQEPRSMFEEEAASGRYKLLEESDEAPRMPDDLQEVRALVTRFRDHYTKQGGRVNNHKAEALSELVEELEQLEPDEVELEDVSGVGAGTAQNLRNAGYSTDVAIQSASIEDLTNVGGVGQKVAERLKDTAT